MLGNLVISLYLQKLSDYFVSSDDIFLQTLILSIIQATATNLCPMIVLGLTNFFVDLLPKTIEKMKFWLPFMTKFSTYTIFLILNLKIFMTIKADHSSFVQEFKNNNFICREDQAAYNLLVFVKIIFNKDVFGVLDEEIHIYCLFYINL